jgi:hypothetical protein
MSLLPRKLAAVDRPVRTTVLFQLAAVLCFALVLGAGGCVHLDKGTPDKPSPYAGDSALFDADQAITTGYDMLHVFVSWEFKNRAQLASVPEIRKAADHVRAHAEEWIDSASKLRDAYAASPTPENRSALADGLRVLRQAIAETTAYLTRYGPAHNP